MVVTPALARRRWIRRSLVVLLALAGSENPTGLRVWPTVVMRDRGFEVAATAGSASEMARARRPSDAPGRTVPAVPRRRGPLVVRTDQPPRDRDVPFGDP